MNTLEIVETFQVLCLAQNSILRKKKNDKNIQFPFNTLI